MDEPERYLYLPDTLLLLITSATEEMSALFIALGDILNQETGD